MPVQAFPNVPNPELKTANAEFLTAYKNAGLDPSGIAGASWGWDAVGTLSHAISSSGATGGEALRAAIEKVDFVGTNAHYKFSPKDHTGQVDAPKALQIGRYRDGSLEIVNSGT